MVNQTNPAPLPPSPNQPGNGTALTRAVNWKFFYFSLVLGAIGFALELVLWPNLRDNPLYLSLIAVTTFAGFLSLGVRISGLRTHLGTFYRGSLAIVVWGVTALDLWLLVLPLFIADPAANDKDLNFAGVPQPVIIIAPTAPSILTVTSVPSLSISPGPGAVEVTVKPVFEVTATPWNTVTPEITGVTTQPVVTVQPTATNIPVRQLPTPTASVKAATVAPPPLFFNGAFNNRGPEPVVGNVFLGETVEGQKVLRLEAFTSTPGPDLYIYLSRSPKPENGKQVMDGLEVGKLKASKGNQNYPLDTSLDLTKYYSVVVYCKSFSAIFGFATLTKE